MLMPDVAMKIPVYTFVAWSGTGKTTFLEKLVAELKARGKRVATIKHDAHDCFEADKPGKDSWRMTQAGADISVVMSETHSAFMENRPVPLEAMIARIRDVDVILTEGYAPVAWPKISVRRAATGKDFRIPPQECLAVVSDTPVEAAVPAFALDDVTGLADFLLADMAKRQG